MENIQSTTARSHATSTAHIKPRRAGVPCVRCRQMKVKCNASQRFPASCSACTKAGERLKARHAPAHGSENGNGNRVPVYRTPQSEASGTEPTDLSSRPNGPLATSDYSADITAITADLRLGGRGSTRFTHESTGVNFTSNVVAELLEEYASLCLQDVHPLTSDPRYYSHIHPRFPLLLNPTTIIDSYEKAPLLFWTALSISSKDSEKYASDYARLQILVKQLVADIILLGSRSIYLVQALLLLCVWSFPHEDMNKEPFSMYGAVAISMARSLGLHRPQYPFLLFAAKASEIGTLESRTLTWLSCFIVDQWHTARFGVPGSIRPDHTILHAVNVSMAGVPETTRIQLHIALVTSKISSALGECETSTTGLMSDPLPLVRVFETELSTIQTKYANKWSPADEVSFLDARLSLYCYVLEQKTCSSSPSSSSLITLNTNNELITQSCLTAKQLLIILTTFPNTLRQGTLHILRAASYSIFFLLRLLGTAPECIDETDTRNIIRQIFTLMREISQTVNDRRSQCFRVCRITEQMIDYEDWDKETPFLGKAESFMGNNLVADVAARGMIQANMRHAAAQAERDRERERDSREDVEGVPAEVEVEPGFDLDFSIWDPMGWNLNWQDGDDLLFLHGGLGGSS
ncbi:hypothetical protein N7456_007912 [Penicillium angulare]|uniref:Zn(2)-C6 fungal-type domain-containing protein n=1 Tax=Penicillium angulare TaxID=116970 RepID=A0A9W9FBH1_9EURO|nr:hypothetical protein N7456_007912 [Penicillium angulare]